MNKYPEIGNFIALNQEYRGNINYPYLLCKQNLWFKNSNEEDTRPRWFYW